MTQISVSSLPYAVCYTIELTSSKAVNYTNFANFQKIVKLIASKNRAMKN